MNVCSGVPKRGLCLVLWAIVMATVFGAGCSTVRPWERAVLMQRVMAPVLDPMQSTFDTHVFRTREAMSGAEVSGGVSCGCN